MTGKDNRPHAILTFGDETRTVTVGIDLDDDPTAGKPDVALHLVCLWTGADEREAASRQDAMDVEQNLDATGGHHPRQRAAGKGKREIGRAGGKDDLVRSDPVGVALCGDGQHTPREESPNNG